MALSRKGLTCEAIKGLTVCCFTMWAVCTLWAHCFVWLCIWPLCKTIFWG
ncbi:unnamed protein product [Staurois parvus]|uniref:Uncharacterized protein n=1 Tax=Staurois parvus TaxID=386267 RepID=A0ABN9EL79_9NEOB|nr:unnamed protein product [Staurois parvus]